MANIDKKNILLGITGGIAAYKSAELTRLLIKQGHQVRVCMTAAAKQFITPLSMQALSGNPVHSDLLDEQAEAGMGHIELAKWANVIVIAPCSADFMAKLAHGFADDLLSTLCLASAAPLYLAPAMNQQMWKHLATQHNATVLQERGVTLLGPAHGEQACGDIGAGRMLEAVQIADALQSVFVNHDRSLLKGKRILITAGPTREPLDPVRFITNRSSGKMGYSIAQAAVDMGAEVCLISGIVNLQPPKQIDLVKVETALDMLQASQQRVNDADIFIATAAVADYAPVDVAEQKIKKSDEQISITLKKNPDILASISQQYPYVFTVGFAAETEKLEQHARAKLQKKQLDMIAANYVGEQLGFDQPDNALEVYWQDGHQSLPKMDKSELARMLLELIAERLAVRKEK